MEEHIEKYLLMRTPEMRKKIQRQSTQIRTIIHIQSLPYP